MNLRPALLALPFATWLAAVAPVRAQSPTPSPSPAPSAVPESTAAPGSVEWARPVRGKPGYVISPYAPDAGYVDVTGFKHGDEVRCPYSGKKFLAP